MGLAAVLVGWNGYPPSRPNLDGREAELLRIEELLGIHSAEVAIGVFIGAGHLHRLDRGVPSSARIKSNR